MGTNILGFNNAVLSVVDGVLIDNEAHVVTLLISRTQSSKMLIDIGFACVRSQE